MAGQPKTPFYAALGLVVVGLVVFAVWRSDIFAPKAKEANGGGKELLKLPTAQHVEEPAGAGAVTTVKEYAFKSADRLPPVKGTSGYKPLQDNTVRFALNVWAGWAPIIFANQGFKPKQEWTTPDGKKFKVELALIDNPVAMRDAYAAGQVHIGWATLDMLPLFMDELQKDSRTMPRVCQQIDWSNGGDGIVARENIKSISDLRGKKVVLAENSPSQYFVLNALINGGVQPAEVRFVYTADAFQAAAAFAADREKSISAAVSWAPDIYKLAKIPGNRMLVTTGEANHLIADVWFARADFAKDYPGIVEGLVRGILDAVEDLDSQENKQKVAKWMAEGYNIPPDDALGMLGDAHWTNYAENREFFLNANNPTNFERTWENAYFLYRSIGKVKEKVSFEKVMDFSIVQKLGEEEKYKKSANKYLVQFVPKSVAAIKAEAPEILTKTVVIQFSPNDWDIHRKITKEAGGKTVEELYDPRADFVIEEIGKMAGQFGAARIVVEGHTDASMKGQVPAAAVKQLSQHRANAVKEALLRKFANIPVNQIATEGVGWDKPADPLDHARNRRVEVKVYPLEAQ